MRIRIAKKKGAANPVVPTQDRVGYSKVSRAMRIHIPSGPIWRSIGLLLLAACAPALGPWAATATSLPPTATLTPGQPSAGVLTPTAIASPTPAVPIARLPAAPVSPRGEACLSPGEEAPTLSIAATGADITDAFESQVRAYLNARGGAAGLLDALNDVTLTDEAGETWRVKAQVFTTDVTDDGVPEVIVGSFITNGDYVYGPLLIFRCQEGSFVGGAVAEIAGQVLSERDPDPGIRAIVEMNGNATPEIVLSYITVVGTHANFTRAFRILEWDGSRFVDRIRSEGRPEYLATVLNGDGLIWDYNGDDLPDLDLSHGLGRDLETPGPERGDSDLWTWDGEAFVLERTLPPLPVRFHLRAVWDGDAAVLRGEYEQAISRFYFQSLEDKGLWEWSPVPIPDAGGGPLIPAIAVRLVRDPDTQQRLATYTAYRILLVDLVRGDESKPWVQNEIQHMLGFLQRAYEEESAGRPYAQLALEFLREYARDKDIAAACAKAVEYAAARPDEILAPLGGGYYGLGYAPEDICPFTDETSGRSSSPTQKTTVPLRLPFPALAARIPLAPEGEGERLTDLLVDMANQRLYATDSTGRLHILDTDRLTPLATLPAAGRLTLDAANDRLFVSSGDGPLTVVDTAALTITGVISLGGAVAVDPRRRRFFVGQAKPNTVVRAYDLVTLEPVGEIAQPGRPLYNPLRDELYLEYLSLYVVDPETLTIVDKLSLGLSGEEHGWCEGCTVPDNVFLDLAQKVLVVELHTIAHDGPGLLPAPRYFDAVALTEITDPARKPALEAGCFNRPVLAGPVGGYLYWERRYAYHFDWAVNLLVYDLTGDLVDWYDNRSLGRTNPRTRQMYAGEWVYDLPSLTRLGRLPVAVDCYGPVDADARRIYAVRGNTLLVFSETGGDPPLLSVAEAASLAVEREGHSLLFSPDYARDRTVFMIPEYKRFTPSGWDGDLYRSQDGGQTWVRLPVRGRLALSPDFAADHTLFAFGNGLFRSTDGGDTWQPAERGLHHLNIRELRFSPGFAADGTLFAIARYWDLTGDVARQGEAVYRSTDRGQTWHPWGDEGLP